MIPAMAEWGTIVGDRKAWVRDISLTAGLSLFYALLGPFGIEAVPLPQRVVLCLALGFANMVLLWPPMRLALWLGDRAKLPELFVLILGLVLLNAPVTLVSIPIVGLLQPAAPKANPIAIYFLVLTMVLPGGVAYMMIERRLLRPRVSAEPAAAPPPAPAPARLLTAMSPRLGHTVLALQGEDHYVRIHTPLGSELLLMRLRDAIAGLEGLAGEQVHRSWWVAKEAVAAVRADGRRLSLTLTNGLEVPVSRDAAPRLRRAGWLER
jgi:hypothetical protein